VEGAHQIVKILSNIAVTSIWGVIVAGVALLFIGLLVLAAEVLWP
jgi:hypothetical protein